VKRAFSRRNLWESTPRVLKIALGGMFRATPPAWWLGGKFRENRRLVRDAQWWPAERAREYQLICVRAIIEFAYQKTDFYHRLFDSVGFCPGDLKSLDDVGQIPTIDKHVLIEHLPQMCTRSTDARDIDFVSTGGTSGVPLNFYATRDRSSIEYAYLTTSWERAGYRLGMPMAVLRGRAVPLDRTGLHYEYDPILRHHYYSNFHTSESHIRRYLEHIRGIGTCALHAYPSSAHMLARHLMSIGQPPPSNIKSILLESENVYADQMDDIERIFGVRAFASYGHSEKCVFAAQCECTHNYHVWPTYGYFELIDEGGRPVRTSGERGEIVGTGFINTVIPFIRYRTGDRATYIGDSCKACGRAHITICDIDGRAWEEGLVAADGSIVPVIGLYSHDDAFRHVREYQFRQQVPGKAVLSIVPSVSFDETEQRRILASVDRRLRGLVDLEIEIRPGLTKTARGKQPRVIQMCRLPSRQAQGSTDGSSGG
jgi:phenylacetate-CoA ligase